MVLLRGDVIQVTRVCVFVYVKGGTIWCPSTFSTSCIEHTPNTQCGARCFV